MENIENVQHRATRLATSIKGKNYEYRVKHMRLTKLETRRKRGDLIQLFKIINKIDHVNLRNELLEKDKGSKADRRVI